MLTAPTCVPCVYTLCILTHSTFMFYAHVTKHGRPAGRYASADELRFLPLGACATTNSVNCAFLGTSPPPPSPQPPAAADPPRADCRRAASTPGALFVGPAAPTDFDEAPTAFTCTCDDDTLATRFSLFVAAGGAVEAREDEDEEGGAVTGRSFFSGGALGCVAVPASAV